METELGIVALVKLLQPKNATLPMEVTELGMVMLVRPLQLENAAAAMPKQPSAKIMFVPAGIMPLYLYATKPA